MSSRPRNLIILTSDEMRGDCPAFMGNPDCKTPHLDRFAQGGVIFENHFTVHGKCVPARIAIATGRYPHTDGFRNIFEHLKPEQPDVLRTLRAQGYETAVFGLNHVWDDLFCSNTKGESAADYHSFTEGYFDHITKKSYPVPPPPANAPPSPRYEDGFDYIGRITEPIEGFSDQVRTEQAIHYLTQVRDRNRPFFMQLNLSSPHPDYGVEEPWYSMYDRQKIKPWPHELPKNAPLHMRANRQVRTAEQVPQEALREIQAVYYGMISHTDEMMGKVIQTIEQQGLLEDTVIIFMVDHGDFAGQYGLVEKWDTAMYDCIMHVPCVIRAPGLPQGLRVQSMSEHVDIAPTVLELLGIQPTWGIHGQSLLPVIRGERVKEAVFADGGHEQEMVERVTLEDASVNKQTGKRIAKHDTYQRFPQAMARAKMVRTEQWKLIIRLEGGNELYNVKSDPQELNNLYGDAAYNDVVAELQLKLIEWCLRTDTDRPYQKLVRA